MDYFVLFQQEYLKLKNAMKESRIFKDQLFIMLMLMW